MENELKSLKVVYNTLKESFQGVVLQLVSNKNNSKWFIIWPFKMGWGLSSLLLENESRALKCD